MTKPQIRGQSLVELGLVLPILLALILGIVELARMLTIYSAVTAASREGARYGISVGESTPGIPRYLDCAGIRDAAKRAAVLILLSDPGIEINYDHGDVSQSIASCDAGPPAEAVQSGDRIVVTISASYEPIVPLISLPAHPITASTARTLLKAVGG